MPDPKPMRYTSASHDLMDTAAKWNPWNSPVSTAAIKSTTPPARLCIAAFNMGAAGLSRCFEYSEPQAHASEATIRTPAPRRSTRSEPPRCAGPTSSTSPPNPSRSPNVTLATGRIPPGRSQSKITSHNDTVATKSAAIPEGTVCSAQLTPPFPINSSIKPVTAAVHQCAPVGRIPVFRRKTAYSTSPAVTWRIPAKMNGGNDSIPTRIAKYVEPQTTYTAANASNTKVFVRTEDCRGAGVPAVFGCSMLVDMIQNLPIKVIAAERLSVEHHIGRVFLRAIHSLLWTISSTITKCFILRHFVRFPQVDLRLL